MLSHASANSIATRIWSTGWGPIRLGEINEEKFHMPPWWCLHMGTPQINISFFAGIEMNGRRRCVGAVPGDGIWQCCSHQDPPYSLFWSASSADTSLWSAIVGMRFRESCIIGSSKNGRWMATMVPAVYVGGPCGSSVYLADRIGSVIIMKYISCLMSLPFFWF